MHFGKARTPVQQYFGICSRFKFKCEAVQVVALSVPGSHSAGGIAYMLHHSDDGQVASYTACSEIPLKFAVITYRIV